MKLDGNVVCVVTGGASGLGLAAARALLGKGCKVVIADFNKEGGEKIVSEAANPNFKFFMTNVADEKNCQELIAFTVKEFGAVHVVVNSAGVLAAGSLVTSKGVLDTKEIMRPILINVMGTVNVCKFAAQAMIKQEPRGDFNERGVLINVASVAGIEGQRGQVAYSASKGAIIGMTLPMARDLGRFGIRVITVAPGVFETPMASQISQKVSEDIKKSVALGRLGQPEEFGNCVAELCMNSYITGEVLRLDGGVRLPHI